MDQAQFFAPNAPTKYEDILQGVANSRLTTQNTELARIKAQDDADALRRKMAMNAALSGSIVTEPVVDASGAVVARPGDLDEAKYYRAVKENRLDPQQALQGAEFYKAQKANELATAKMNTDLRALGSNPNAMGRAGAPIGAPPTQEQQYLRSVDAQLASAPTADPFDATPAPATAPAGGLSFATVSKVLRGGDVPVNTSAGGEDGVVHITARGPSAGEEGKLTATDMGAGEGAYRPPVLPVDTRTSAQAVEDSYDPANGLLAPKGTAPDALAYENLTPNARKWADKVFEKSGFGVGKVGFDAARAQYLASVAPPSIVGSKDGGIDIFATKAAINKYEADKAAADKKFSEDLVSGNVGQQQLSNANEANARARTTFSQDQAAIKDIADRYGVKVPASQIGKAQELAGQVEVVNSYNRDANDFANFIKTHPRATPEEIEAHAKNLNNLVTVAESIGTEGAANAYFSDLSRANKSVGQLINEMHGQPVGSVIGAVQKTIASLPPQERAKLYLITAQAAAKNGVALSKLRGLGKGAKTGLQPETVPRAAKGSDARQPGESFTDFLRRTRK